MDVSFVKTPEIQQLLDRAAGVNESGGNPRLKAIMRDLTESLMNVEGGDKPGQWNAGDLLSVAV